jgi:hypothetical protein
MRLPDCRYAFPLCRRDRAPAPSLPFAMAALIGFATGDVAEWLKAAVC